MSIELALHDAATNCRRDGATATITLRSGVQITGKLDKQSGADLGTRHMTFADGGWGVFQKDEIAAVEVHP